MKPSFNKSEILNELLGLGSHPSPNVFMAVPTIYVNLIDEIQNRNLDKVNFDHIRLMVSGSAAMPRPISDQWERLSNVKLLERYGMTEIGMALSQSLDEDLRLDGAVGQPMLGVSARIRTENDILVPFDNAADVHGELEIKTESIFIEYWKLPDKTKEEFTDDGWFKTGDTAKFENGHSFILGRSSVDIIKSGGYKISALEIERILLEHANIEECAVVGVSDEKWGEIVCMIAAFNNGSSLSVDELKIWAKPKMASYKIPSTIIEVEALPRNQIGKINKKQLKIDFNIS